MSKNGIEDKQKISEAKKSFNINTQNTKAWKKYLKLILEAEHQEITIVELNWLGILGPVPHGQSSEWEVG